MLLGIQLDDLISHLSVHDSMYWSEVLFDVQTSILLPWAYRGECMLRTLVVKLFASIISSWISRFFGRGIYDNPLDKRDVYSGGDQHIR